jgi:hypothetical protein
LNLPEGKYSLFLINNYKKCSYFSLSAIVINCSTFQLPPETEAFSRYFFDIASNSVESERKSKALEDKLAAVPSLHNLDHYKHIHQTIFNSFDDPSIIVMDKVRLIGNLFGGTLHSPIDTSVKVYECPKGLDHGNCAGSHMVLMEEIIQALCAAGKALLIDHTDEALLKKWVCTISFL